MQRQQSQKDHRTQDARHAQVLAGFNVYRTPRVCELLDKVEVSTCYNGVVLEDTAEIVAVDQRGVTFSVGELHARALRETEIAVVASPLHGTSFTALVSPRSSNPGEVHIRGFTPFKECMGRRKHSRVTPVHVMLARLTADDQEATGRVIDVSSTHFAATIDRRALRRFGASRRVECDVWGEYDLDDGLVDFRTSGKIVKLFRLAERSDSVCKVVIEMELYLALRDSLNRYVVRRQREILLALETLQR